MDDQGNFQTRNNYGALRYFSTLKEAMDFANDAINEVWKVSFPVGNERIRLVRHYTSTNLDKWTYDPIDLIG